MSVVPYLIGTKQFAQNQQMQDLAWNLANAAVPGYKQTGMAFHPLEKPFEDQAVPGMVGVTYPIQGLVWKDRNQGAFQPTGNPHHLAISGEGFFSLADGTYTRDGQISLTTEGELVAVSDNRTAFLDTEGSSLRLLPDSRSITVAKDGRVTDQLGRLLGRLGIVQFTEVDQLQSVGYNRYRSSEEPMPCPESRVLQGFLESSNVSAPQVLAQAQAVKTQYAMLGAFARDHFKAAQQLTNYLVTP